MLRKEIITVKNPSKLKVCEGLPGEGAEIKTMSPEQFVEYARSKKNSIKAWSENITLEEEVKIEEFKDESYTKSKTILDEISLKLYQHHISVNLNDLALSYMGPELGFGVFALKEFPMNMPIGFYAGDMYSSTPLENNLDYGYCLGWSQNKYLVIDSNDKGNITRFFQHSFEEKCARSLYKIKTEKFSAANLNAIPVFYKSFPLVLFYSNRIIKKNEMLSFDYTDDSEKSNYWSVKGVSPFLFSYHGAVLKSPSEYEVTNINLTLLSPSKILKGSMTFCIPVQDIDFHIKNQSMLTLEDKAVGRFCVKPEILREAREKQPHSPFIRCYASLFQMTPKRCKESILKLLKDLTGLVWTYDPKKQSAFTKAPVEDDLLKYLKEKGFPISKKLVAKSASHPLAGQSILHINWQSIKNLQQELERFADIPPFNLVLINELNQRFKQL